MGLEPGQPRYRVLVIDDDPDGRTVLRHLLEAVGFDVSDAIDEMVRGYRFARIVELTGEREGNDEDGCE